MWSMWTAPSDFDHYDSLGRYQCLDRRNPDTSMLARVSWKKAVLSPPDLDQAKSVMLNSLSSPIARPRRKHLISPAHIAQVLTPVCSQNRIRTNQTLTNNILRCQREAQGCTGSRQYFIRECGLPPTEIAGAVRLHAFGLRRISGGDLRWGA